MGCPHDPLARRLVSMPHMAPAAPLGQVRLCVFVCLFVSACVLCGRSCARVCVCLWLCVCLCVCVCMCLFVFLFVFVFVFLCAYVCECVYVCVYVCEWVWSLCACYVKSIDIWFSQVVQFRLPPLASEVANSRPSSVVCSNIININDYWLYLQIILFYMFLLKFFYYFCFSNVIYFSCIFFFLS